MGSLSLSLKVVLISTSVLFLSSYLKVFVTLVHGFYVNQASLLWTSLVSWLKPPYLYVIINCIIITIVASSRFDHNHDTNSTTTHDHIEKIPMDDYVHGMKISTVKTRFDGALKSRALIVYQDRVEEEEEEVIQDKCMVIEDRENGVAGDFVISKGKPLVSSRFGHGKVVKARPEGGRALRVGKPQPNETLENIWKKITEDRAMPLTRHVKKPQTPMDTWENHGSQSSTSRMDPRAVSKSETLNGRTNYQLPPVSSSSPASGKLRKEPSLSQEELNQRAEAFINKFNEEMRMQRQGSFNTRR